MPDDAGSSNCVYNRGYVVTPHGEMEAVELCVGWGGPSIWINLWTLTETYHMGYTLKKCRVEFEGSEMLPEILEYFAKHVLTDTLEEEMSDPTEQFRQTWTSLPAHTMKPLRAGLQLAHECLSDHRPRHRP